MQLIDILKIYKEELNEADAWIMQIGTNLVALKYGIYREITNGYVLSSPHYQSFKESENKKLQLV